MRRVFVLILCILYSGCSSTIKGSSSVNSSGVSKKKESRQEVKTAIGSVMSAVSGQEISQSDIKQFEKQIRKDKEAQTAVQVIADSITNANVKIKYCPVCGKRFSPHISICPEHKVDLEKVLDE